MALDISWQRPSQHWSTPKDAVRLLNVLVLRGGPLPGQCNEHLAAAAKFLLCFGLPASSFRTSRCVRFVAVCLVRDASSAACVWASRDGTRRAGVRVEVRVVRVASCAVCTWASRDGRRRAGVRVEARVVRLVSSAAWAWTSRDGRRPPRVRVEGRVFLAA